MSHLFWLDQERLNRIEHIFPKPRGVARVDDRRVLSGIIHVIRIGLRWRDAPPDYGPHKTLYNRWARWSHMGVFARILAQQKFAGLRQHDSAPRYSLATQWLHVKKNQFSPRSNFRKMLILIILMVPPHG